MRPRRSEINPAPSSSHPSSIYLSYPFHPSFPFVPPVLSETFRDEIMKNWNRKIIAHFHLKKKKKEEEESKCFFVSITLRTNPPHFLSVISTRCPKCTLLLVSGPPPLPPWRELAVSSTGLSQPSSHAISECKKKKKKILLFNIWPCLFLFFNFCYFLNTVKLCIQV